MDVTFYTTTDDKRKVSKSLTTVSILSCEIYNGCDIINPLLLLEYSATITSCNYMYIPDFHRYYFVTNITVDAGGRMIVVGEIDVLQTYATSILALDATVTRNEYTDDTLLVDPLATFIPEKTVNAYVITPTDGTPFNVRDYENGSNFVIVIAGGYVSG